MKSTTQRYMIKIIQYLCLLGLFGRTARSATLPALTVTINKEKIFESVEENGSIVEGKMRSMTVSTNQEKSKIVISRVLLTSEPKGNTAALAYDVGNDDFENERKFPLTPSDLSLTFFIKETKVVVVEGRSSNGKSAQINYYDIEVDKVTVDTADRGDPNEIIPLAGGSQFESDAKPEANLRILSFSSTRTRNFYLWNTETGATVTYGRWEDIKAVEFLYMHTAYFNPNVASNHIFLTGETASYKNIYGLLDSSKLGAADKTTSLILSVEKTTWKDDYLISISNKAAYNLNRNSHVLALSTSQGFSQNRIGLYLKTEETPSIEVEALLKLDYPGSGLFFSNVTPKSIEGTDYFFVHRMSHSNSLQASAEIYIVDSTSDPAATSPPELDFLKVTDILKPSGLDNVNVMKAEPLNKNSGKWVIIGNDRDSTNGWAMIVTLGSPYRPALPTCHTDCFTCLEHENENSCTKCNDEAKQVVIEEGKTAGPCKIPCHSSCLTCVESTTEKEKKCLKCPEGKFLTSEVAPSSCGDCHEACNGCSIAEDSTKCLSCASGYVDNSGTCEKNANNDGGKVNEEEEDCSLINFTAKCGGVDISLCKKCFLDGTQGCQECQKGSKIEVKDGIKRCVRCAKGKSCECLSNLISMRLMFFFGISLIYILI